MLISQVNWLCAGDNAAATHWPVPGQQQSKRELAPFKRRRKRALEIHFSRWPCAPRARFVRFLLQIYFKLRFERTPFYILLPTAWSETGTAAKHSLFVTAALTYDYNRCLRALLTFL